MQSDFLQSVFLQSDFLQSDFLQFSLFLHSQGFVHSVFALGHSLLLQPSAANIDAENAITKAAVKNILFIIQSIVVKFQNSVL